MATRKFIDIGANLTDPMFSGIYHGSKKHPADLDRVLQRAYDAGVEKIIVTAGCRADIAAAKKLCSTDSRLFYTVGCHPTRCNEFAANPEAYYAELKEAVAQGGSRVVAIGECGLDYDREYFCAREVQLPHFRRQLDLAAEVNLPLFLHCRNAFNDFATCIRKHVEEKGALIGCVHSFDGTLEQAQTFIDLDLHIGFNGCSLKTEGNLEVAASVAEDRILLETDAPWCDIRPTHAGFSHVTPASRFERVKPHRWTPERLVVGRNEPACIAQVNDVVSAVRGISPDRMAAVAFENTFNAFPGLLATD